MCIISRLFYVCPHELSSDARCPWISAEYQSARAWRVEWDEQVATCCGKYNETSIWCKDCPYLSEGVNLKSRQFQEECPTCVARLKSEAAALKDEAEAALMIAGFDVDNQAARFETARQTLESAKHIVQMCPADPARPRFYLPIRENVAQQ